MASREEPSAGSARCCSTLFPVLATRNPSQSSLLSVGPEASNRQIRSAIADVCDLLWSFLQEKECPALWLLSTGCRGVSSITESPCATPRQSGWLTVMLSPLLGEAVSSVVSSSSSAVRLTLPLTFCCATAPASALTSQALPLSQLGSKHHFHMPLSPLRGSRVQSIQTVPSSSQLPRALPRSCIPCHPWRPLGCLSVLSAGSG